jgi:asparagine synthase (glutamine-hydrolysing)
VWLVFNGEVYNYRDLRRRLEGSGHRFRTNGDAEVLVHLYEDLGPECFAHVDGMLAAAIWDANHRRLVLGRDRLGKKPLVFRFENERLFFASELKALLTVPEIPREIDPGAIDEYLTYQYIPPPNTIFRGIRKLPPAHYAVFQDGNLTVKPYWQPDWTREVSLPIAEAEEQVRTLFDSSVAARLQADVPLGAFLSGGIDSSLVVASMQQQAQGRVKTFSIGFPQPEYDETSFARQVAKHLGTEHTELQVTPNAVEILPKLAFQYDGCPDRRRR